MKNYNKDGSLGVVGVLTIVFVVLKLVGAISWSWWWVLSPLWISGALFVIVVLILLLVLFILNKADR